MCSVNISPSPYNAFIEASKDPVYSLTTVVLRHHKKLC